MYSQVEEVDSLVIELAKLTKQERALLEQCTHFISLLAAMQVDPHPLLSQQSLPSLFVDNLFLS